MCKTWLGVHCVAFGLLKCIHEAKSVDAHTFIKKNLVDHNLGQKYRTSSFLVTGCVFASN